MEALENADIFYEMQYKEVKIVAKVSVHELRFGDSSAKQEECNDLCKKLMHGTFRKRMRRSETIMRPLQ